MAKLSPIGRVSYPSVFEPDAYGDEDPKYNVTLVFEGDTDTAVIDAAVEEAIKKKWAGKRPTGLTLPLKTDEEKYEGQPFARFSAKQDRPPQIVDQAKQQIDSASGRFYPGCYARVSFNAYAWEYMGKRGVSLGLNNIQKTGDGEPFDGRSSADDDFDSVEVEDSEFV